MEPASVDEQLRRVLRWSAPRRVEDGIVCFAVDDDETHDRWDDAYAAISGAEQGDTVFTRTALGLIRRSWRGFPNGRFLELGCGDMRIGTAIEAAGAVAYGLDFSLRALHAARVRLRRQGFAVRLVQADIRAMPFESGTFDAVYGGGVIEHVRELDDTLRELRRITAVGGVTINTVPYMSLGALTYRQVWGNIPAMPGLRQAGEMVHIRLLRGRHMRFGYERSYPAFMLRRAYARAGFEEIAIARYDVPLVFEYLPERLKPVAARLSRHRLFWPMISVVAHVPRS